MITEAPRRRYVLTNIRLKRVSLVEVPANEASTVVLFKSEVGSQSRGNMPDSNFAAVWTDADGNKQRKLLIHDAAHVRAALARWNQTDMPADVKSKARSRLEAAARRLGVEVGDKKEKAMTKCPKCGAEVPDGKSKCPDCGTAMKDGANDADADDAGKKKGADMEELEQVKAKLAESEAALAKAVKDLAEATKAKEDATKAASADDDVLKGLTPQVKAFVLDLKKQTEASEAKAQLASDKLAAMDDERVTKEFVEVAKGMRTLQQKPEVLGPILKRVSQGKTVKGDVEELIKILTAASKSNRPMLVQVGSDHPAAGATSAEAQIDALITEMVTKSEGKMDYKAALDKVAKDEPELYARYVEERRDPKRSRAAQGEE